MEDIIKKINDLDLRKSSSENEFNAIMQKAGYQPMLVPIAMNTFLYRAVPPKKGENYHNKDFLKYHPKPKLQRANLENQPTFYGMWLFDDTDFQNANLTCASETSKSIRNYTNGKYTTGVDNYVLSQWLTQKELHLFAVVDPQIFNNSNNRLLINLQNTYKKYIQYLQNYKCASEISKIQELNTFFANKFAEKVNEDEQDKYKLTAYLSNYLRNLHVHDSQNKEIRIDGILYPSVRSEGKGVCVAISQNTVDENEFKLNNCSDRKLYCFNEKAFIAGSTTKVNEICKQLDIPLCSKELFCVLRNQLFFRKSFLKS